MDLFIGRNYVVTIHRGRVPALEDALARWTRGGPMMREGVGFLVYTVMDALIDTYFPVIDAIEDEIEEIELALFGRFAARASTTSQAQAQRWSCFAACSIRCARHFTFSCGPTTPIFRPARWSISRMCTATSCGFSTCWTSERDMASGGPGSPPDRHVESAESNDENAAVLTVAVAILSAVFGAWGMNFAVDPAGRCPVGLCRRSLAGTFAILGLLGLVAWRRWM